MPGRMNCRYSLVEPLIAPPKRYVNITRNRTGVSVTSMSCSGTCLIFSIPRQPNVLAALNAPGRGRARAGGQRGVQGGVGGGLLRAGRGRLGRRAHAATSSCVSSSSARWPVSARKTSSRLGCARAKPASPRFAPESSATASAARSGSSMRIGERGRVGFEVRLGVERAGEDPRCLVALLRVEQPDAQRAAADGGLQGGRRALGDDLAVVDHRDAVGELVGLVEVLRAQQHGGAEAGERADDVPHLVARARVQAGRRLVEEHELGGHDDAGGEVQPPAHAAGEVLHEAVRLPPRGRTRRAARPRGRAPASSGSRAAARAG